MDDYFSIQTAEHYTSMFGSLHTLQKQGVLCDVILVAEDGEVMAHKVLLMAASNYFRQRLSPVVSTPVSRIYLKGISVVELANLVKYIYTGKLLIARETMEVTLEVSEILELNGVLKGYSDIMEYERRFARDKVGNAELDHITGQPISGQDVHMSLPQEGSVVHQKSSTATLMEGKPEVVHQTVTHNQEEIRVTAYCDDGSAVTYTVEQTDGTEIPTTSHTSTSDYNFEFNPFEQQYMDVSAGNSTQQLQTTNTSTTKLHISGTEDIVIDEEAQHQDLLSVAIEKLSDGSQVVDSDGTISSASCNKGHTSPSKTSDKYVNGKTDTKIVTLSAGKISNDLGGHTSVYTVALDPSTIKQPLQMPRFQRRKTEKERQAEQNAKRYRQKKAELIAGKSYPDNKTVTDQTLVENISLNETIQLDHQVEVCATEEVVTLPGSLSPAQKVKAVLNFPVQEELSMSYLRAVNKDPLLTDTQDTQSEPVTCMTGEVNVIEVLDKNVGSKTREDFSCSVDFDCEDDGDTKGNATIIEKATDIKKNSPKKVSITDQKIKGSNNSKKNRNTCKAAKVGSFMVKGPTTRKTRSSLQENLNASMPSVINSVSESESILSEKEENNELTHGANDKQIETGVESPEKNENAMLDGSRSSASKRKRKVPRRLSLSTGEKNAGKSSLNSRNFPLVRTRRYSRNEGSTGRRCSVTLDSEQTEHGEDVIKKDVEGETIFIVKTDDNLETEGYTELMNEDDNLESESLTELQDEEDNLESESFTELHENNEAHAQNEDNNDDNNLFQKATDLGTFEKHMLPEIRLMKLSSKDVRELEESGRVRQVVKSDTVEESDRVSQVVKDDTMDEEKQSEASEGFVGEIKVDIQTFVSSSSCDEIVGDADMDENDTVTKQKGLKRKRTKQKTSIKKENKKAKSLVCEKCFEAFDFNIQLSKHLKKCKSELNVPQFTKSATKSRPTRSPRKAETVGNFKENEDKTKQPNIDQEARENVATDVKLDITDLPFTYICPEDNCSYTSKQMNNVRRHRTSFHGSDSCLEKPIEKVQMNHDPNLKQGDTRDDEHVCKCCRSVFRTRIALKGHIKSKLMFCNSNCIYCGVKFKKGTVFFNHLYQEHGISVFENIQHFTCKECKFIGFSKKEITIHNQKHDHGGDMVKSFKCLEETNQELKLHLKNTHRYKLECPDCDFITYTKTSLMTHTKLKHSTDKEIHACQFCGYETPLVGNLRKHILKVHKLIVVTKQSKYNQVRFKGYDEKTFLTMDGELFDPKTMPLPKLSSRIHKQDMEPDENSDGTKKKLRPLRGKRGKKVKVPLLNLSTEDFTKEILKRHDEYLKKPEKVHRVMSKSLAVATAHPSFPQASPNVRVNKANKLYHTPKMTHSYTELTGAQAEQYITAGITDSSLPSVGSEVEILEHGINSENNLVVSIPDGVAAGTKVLQVVIDQDGQKSLVDTMNVVSALIEAGHHIEVQEELEIQNE